MSTETENNDSKSDSERTEFDPFNQYNTEIAIISSVGVPLLSYLAGELTFEMVVVLYLAVLTTGCIVIATNTK